MFTEKCIQILPAKFLTPDTEHLWLVVSGAPKEHNEVSGKDELNPQWPYEIKLKGVTLDDSVLT